VLVEGGTANGRNSLPAGSDVQLVNWPRDDGVYVLPFFSSIARIREATSAWYDAAQMTGRELFEATCGQLLYLNPRCQHGCALEPHDVAMLLDTGTVANMSIEMTRSARQVIVEPAHDLSKETIDALNELHRRAPIARAAYLVRFRYPDSSEKPTLVIAIEASPEENALLRTVLRETSCQSEIVDLLFIRSTDHGIGQYIAEQVRPFYRVRSPDSSS
jgi:hypothetical protein